MGPVCEKKNPPAAKVERDLFGFDIEKAAAYARFVVQTRIEALALQAKYDIQRGFDELRRKLGVPA